MAYARPFGQAQGASPWTSGVPPGLQQQHQQQAHAQPMQPMFNQPMGAFDISGAWQGQPQQQAAAQQWVQPQMQQVQFVPNPTFMQQQQPQLHHHNNQHQPRMHQQRPMHQRSLSAPRIGVNGQKRPMNQNNSIDYGGQQQQRWRQQNNNNNNNNQQQQQPQQPQRFTRQQSRMNNQKGPNNNNNNNNSSNNNNNNSNHSSNNKQRQAPPQQQQQQQPQQQQQQKQQQQQQQPQQQSAKQGPRKVTVVKVTKVKKQAVLKAKLANKNTDAGNQKGANNADETKAVAVVPDDDSKPQAKTQSKTAERKQLKLQARKNAEALNQSKLPVVKAAGQLSDSDKKVDEPIDQAQLKCVPAVFGFVCKLCNVFLRDKVARREHIDSAEHLDKFKLYEEEEAKKVAQEGQDQQKNGAEEKGQANASAKVEPTEPVESTKAAESAIAAETTEVAESTKVAENKAVEPAS